MDSTQPIISNFKVKIAVDTQILSYLLDKSYPFLNIFFNYLLESPFVEIVCSRFVTFEIIGIRKKEHYLRAVQKKANAVSGEINFSSLLKYSNDWSAPELDYHDTYTYVKEKVEGELKIINDDYKISYEEFNLHSSLWKPHQELVLSSKISKEDSLVLVSIIYPNENQKEEYLVFLTNDNQFYNSICCRKEPEATVVNDIFDANSIIKPTICLLKAITTPISNKVLNIVDSVNESEEIVAFAKQFVFEHIKKKNETLILGEIVDCPKSMKGKLLCFKLESDSLAESHYVSVLSKELDFLYSHPVELSSFYNKIQIPNYPYVPMNDEGKNISVILNDEDGKPLSEDIYDSVTSIGNVLFIHPDSI
ncbi:MAG: hypothetical protein WCG08_15315 [Paludibacter sp.]